MRRLHSPLAILFALFLGACATVAGLRLDDRFGPDDPTRYDRPPQSVAGSPDYWRDVRPVLDRRCVSCHACYDAPCQLNLTSYSGLTRGANPDPVYWTTPRLFAAQPTRLDVDARLPSQWREKGFFPVLNERPDSPLANREASVLHRLLDLKRQHPGQTGGPLTDKDIDTSLDRDQICTTAEGVSEYSRRHPTRGMPFALPPLSEPEHQTLSRWIESGAPYKPLPPLSPEAERQVAEWESFLNGNSLKEQLTARYIFEHWYVAHLWFADTPGQFFELVRSRTAPGQPIERIASRRPYDDPGVPRVWYRLQRLEQTPVAKTHMPLRLDTARLNRLRTWFLKPAYRVEQLPGYAPEIAANPFISFRDLPMHARYRLMLDEAHYTLSTYMKGPVCRGQVALNSINDYFWVVFVAPDNDNLSITEDIIRRAAPQLRLPAEEQSTAGLLAWRRFAKQENEYMVTRAKLLGQLDKKQARPTLDDIWNGEGSNPNAALTVFRHFDSASVVQGLAGDRPQTTFVMGYPLLERMHYLLVAGFDVYGNVGHQLLTRLYMDFLRMEGELNFLSLLPMADRQPVLNHWYRNRSEQHNRYLADAAAYFPLESGVRYRSKDTLSELWGRLKTQLPAARNPDIALESTGLSGEAVNALRTLGRIKGTAAAEMPEASLLLIDYGKGKSALVTLLRNSAHSNVAELFAEDKRRLPQEDTLIALNGVATAYPNALFRIEATQLADFARLVSQLDGQDAMSRLTDRFGIRRTDPRFWPVSDRIHDLWQSARPIDYGILDYSRLENN